jgi:hypothetical protein
MKKPGINGSGEQSLQAATAKLPSGVVQRSLRQPISNAVRVREPVT